MSNEMTFTYQTRLPLDQTFIKSFRNVLVC